MKTNKLSIAKLKKELAAIRRSYAATENKLDKLKDIENELKVSEEKYKSIVEGSLDGVIMVQNGRIVFVNGSFIRMFGYGEEELVGESILRFVHPDSREMISKYYITRLKGGHPPSCYTFKGLKKDGTSTDVEMSVAAPIVYKGEKTTLAILRDISDRMKMEHKLELLNNCFLSFTVEPEENINQLVKLCGQMLRSDCSLYNRFDKGMLCSIGQWNTPDDYINSDNAEGHICYDVLRTCADDIVVINDLQNTKYASTDPNVKKFELNTYLGMGVKFGNICIGTLCVVYKARIIPSSEDKRIMTLIASAIAIEEERLSAEAAIRENHTRYQNIFENSPISLWEEDFSNVKIEIDRLKNEGVKDLDSYIDQNPDVLYDLVRRIKVIDVNKATLALYRVKTKKEFWQGISTFLMEDSYSAAKEQIIRIAEGKRDFQCETVNQTINGEKVNVFLNWAVIPGQEETYSRVLVSIIDITDRVVAQRVLEVSEQKFKGLNDNLPNLVFIVNARKTFYVNKLAEEKLGVTKDIVAKKDLDFNVFVAKEYKKQFQEAVLVSLSGKNPGQSEIDLLSTSGKTMSVIVSLQRIDYNGDSAVLGIATDVTEIHRIKHELTLEKENMKRYMDLVASIVVALDREGKVTMVNKTVERMLGYQKREIIGKSWFATFIPKEDRQKTTKFFNEMISDKAGFKNTFENRVLRKDGTELDISWSNTILRDKDGGIKGTLSAGNDITFRINFEKEKEILNMELSKTNKRLRQMILRDPQTGLFNHRYLADAIEVDFSRAKRYAHHLSVIMMDIDYFKSINDVYGHKFGDIVINQFAHELKKMVRTYDIVIRFGGEEFLVIIPGADELSAQRVAEKYIETINLINFGDKQHKVKLTLSIGVAAFPELRIFRGIDLVNFACKIMDKAKEEGGNRVCTSKDVNIDKKHDLKTELERGEVKSLKTKIEKLNKKAKQSIIESIFAFAKTIELKDHYTGEHVEKTVHYATELAKELALPKNEIDLIKQAAILHDLGKIGISDKILMKKGSLTKREFGEIKKHPQIGADIIRPIQFLHDMIPLIFYHHERWDGKGYPSGLSGDEIPIGARVIALADAFQALSSDRPYRKAFSRRRVMKILAEESGTKYDPTVVSAFFRVLEKGNKT